MKVPFVDLSRSYSKTDVMARIESVVDTGSFVYSPEITKFEDMFSTYLGVGGAVALSSGTAALELALKALGIGRYDKVLVPANSFVATAFAVSNVGGIPIFADVDPLDWTLSLDIVKKAFDEHERFFAVIPVHLFGLAIPDIKEITEFCHQKGTFVIEDCAQALGAETKHGKIGTFGDINCFDGRAQVLTENGYVSISSIKVGDKVLTHRNRYRQVTKLYKREHSGDFYKIKLRGMRSTKAWGKRWIRPTEEHPLFVLRDGNKEWVCAKDLRLTDFVYIRASKCFICGKLIPFFWKLCEYCNTSEQEHVRNKIAKSKDTGVLPRHLISKSKHYYEDIIPYAEKLKEDGYRVIPIGVAVPDIIAIKDGQITAIEVENGVQRKKKQLKYSEELKSYYDDIKWVYPNRCELRNAHKLKALYIPDEELELVAVPVESIEKLGRRKRKENRTVFNLEVEEDNTYFVSDVVVHNCFSFYPTKNLGCFGNGGMVSGNKAGYYNGVRLLKSYGFNDKNKAISECIGTNANMDTIQAVVLQEQLRRLDENNAKRIAAAQIYEDILMTDDVLTDSTDIQNLGMSHLGAKYKKHVYHLYVITVSDKRLRDPLVAYLRSKDIGCAVHYPIPIHRQPAYRDLRTPPLPCVEFLAERMISLPMFAGITRDEINYVCSTIREFFLDA